MLETGKVKVYDPNTGVGVLISVYGGEVHFRRDDGAIITQNNGVITFTQIGRTGKVTLSPPRSGDIIVFNRTVGCSLTGPCPVARPWAYYAT